MVFGFKGVGKEVAEDAGSLETWFKDTETLSRASITKDSRPPAPGQQGYMLEAVSVMADSAPVFSAVLSAFGTWLVQRLQQGQVTVTITCPNGVTITETARRQADVPALKQRIITDCQV
ncbi:effector-associated constant component EACC1 [Streptomyces coerulescens]|uniref:Uncharacterized protein n=1 Tax=Streptomyces coerulescens TaxID=29304 RepID=A0ABW0CB35_STRCD